MIEPRQAAPVIAEDLRAAERTAMTAARDLAQLIVSAADATLNCPVAMCVGARPIATFHEAMGAVVACQRLLRKGHMEVEQIGRRLGLTEEMWGGSAPKDLPPLFTAQFPDCTSPLPGGLPESADHA